MFISVSMYSFYDITTIGDDYRYFLFVFTVPITLGMIILGLIRLNRIKETLSEENSIFVKIALAGFLILKGFLISFASFGVVAHISWVKLNKNTIKQSPKEYINCQVYRLTSGTSKMAPSVHFYFLDSEESIHINSKTHRKYFETDPQLLTLQLQLREGIWNKYVVDNWKIIKNPTIKENL